jgi:hypothetical protein
MSEIPQFDPNESCPSPKSLQYFQNLMEDYEGLIVERELLRNMKISDIEARIGGKIDEFSYQVLKLLFPDGLSDEDKDDEVKDREKKIESEIFGNTLREKRREYLKSHPDEEIGKGADKGVSTYDGRFIPIATYLKMTMRERFAEIMGPRCCHWEEVPGFGTSDENAPVD